MTTPDSQIAVLALLVLLGLVASIGAIVVLVRAGRSVPPVVAYWRMPRR